MTAAPRNKDTRLDHLFNFLECAKDKSNAELSEELESHGVSVAKLGVSVSEILSRADRVTATPSSPAWLERARAKRRWFDGQVRKRVQEVADRYKDSRELMAAMLSGELGMGVQARAGVFFRNKKAEDLSPEDMRSFLEDCELLQDLDSEDSEKKPGE